MNNKQKSKHFQAAIEAIKACIQLKSTDVYEDAILGKLLHQLTEVYKGYSKLGNTVMDSEPTLTALDDGMMRGMGDVPSMDQKMQTNAMKQAAARKEMGI